ncbi:glycosyltransferase [Pararhodonellum marinum]|uniref:glycosyltransferase n=1 Tax=Pararhodonellum marinum TaxID=2755358 RepID=UPI00188FA184|nr:glycosyltransferase [Pararhodonellum marinum]
MNSKRTDRYTYTPLPEPIPITDQNWPEGALPIVSTRTMAYLHQDYIRDCIEGILMQKTTFPVQVLIHDDASTDGTQTIIKEYQQKYPNLIKVYFQKENSYRQDGQTKTAMRREFFSWIKGKYIALCEGDDYWTDPFKLQKQVDFLERYEDVILTYGNAKIQDLSGSYHKKDFYLKSFKSQKISKDAVFGLGVPTLTMMYRNIVEFPKELKLTKSGDQFMRLYLSTFGDFYNHGEVFGVHRKHDKGVSRVSNKLEWNLNTVNGLKMFMKYMNNSQKRHIKEKISEHSIYSFYLAIYEKKIKSSFLILMGLIGSPQFYTRKSLGIFRHLGTQTILKKNYKVFDIF